MTFGGGGHPSIAPKGLHITVFKANGVAATHQDISAMVPRESVTITRDARTNRASLSFRVVDVGGTLNLIDHREVRCWTFGASLTDNQYFFGYTILVDSSYEEAGNIKYWTVRCVDVNYDLQFPPRQPVNWPLFGGTPVVNTTAAASVAAGSARSFTARRGLHMYTGKRVYAQNCNGTNRERITLTVATQGRGTTGAVADFVTAKTSSDHTISSGAITASAVAQTITFSPAISLPDPQNANDNTAVPGGLVAGTMLIITNPVVSTTLGQAVTGAPTAQTVTVGSSASILQGQQLLLASGTAREEYVTVTAVPSATSITAIITTNKNNGDSVASQNINEEVVVLTQNSASATTATGVFTLPHPSNSLVKVRWQLLGGISYKEFIADGWSQHDTGTGSTVVAVDGLIDRFYNDEGLTVDKNAVSDIGPYSMPVKVWQAATPEAIMQEVENEYLDTQAVDTTLTSLITASASPQWVPVANIANITIGRELTIGTGGSQETVSVLNVVVGDGEFRATFTKNHANGETVVGGTQPGHNMSLQNGAWTRQLKVYDKLNTNLTTIALKEAASISTGTETRYHIPYTRTLDGNRRYSKQTVVGSANAVGSYEDENLSSEMGRTWEAPVVVDARLTSAEACEEAARWYVEGFKVAKETIRVQTNTRISSGLFYEGMRVNFEHSGEGGTPADYYIANTTLTFPTAGLPLWTFELGDALDELGDRPMPRLGAGTTVDRVSPSAPTWASSNGWILENVYVPSLRQSRVQIQWQSGHEADLARFRVFDGPSENGPWFNPRTIVYPDHTCTYLLDAQVARYFWVEAFDRNGNFSDPSPTVNLTTAAPVLPDPPTDFADGSADTTPPFRWGAGMAKYLWTPPATQPYEYRLWQYRSDVAFPEDDDAASQFIIPGINHGFTARTGLVPGYSYQASIYSRDQYGHESVPATSDVFTMPLPMLDRLDNGDFEVYDSGTLDGDKFDEWTINTTGIVFVSRDDTGKLDGKYCLKIIGTTGATVELLSWPVRTPDASTTTLAALVSMVGRAVFRSTSAAASIEATINWYDGVDLDNPIGSVAVLGSTTMTTAIQVAQPSSKTPPTGTRCARLYITITFTATETAFLGGCKLEPGVEGKSVKGASISPSDLFLNNSLAVLRNGMFAEPDPDAEPGALTVDVTGWTRTAQVGTSIDGEQHFGGGLYGPYTLKITDDGTTASDSVTFLSETVPVPIPNTGMKMYARLIHKADVAVGTISVRLRQYDKNGDEVGSPEILMDNEVPSTGYVVREMTWLPGDINVTNVAMEIRPVSDGAGANQIYFGGAEIKLASRHEEIGTHWEPLTWNNEVVFFDNNIVMMEVAND